MPRCTAASTSWPRHGATSRVSTTTKPKKLRQAQKAPPSLDSGGEFVAQGCRDGLGATVET
ncbi:hypothetical protein ASF25_20820 [Methylobacterium sp. Leaf100]|nr:hypothetical protein ASF25_20820 [Methylobacterium sp. Leaf100]